MEYISGSRRHLLATLGIAGVAGCAGKLPFNSETGIQVGNIEIKNLQRDPVALTLRLDRDGTTVYQNTIELDGYSDDGSNQGAYELIEQSWPSEPAQYTILFTAQGTERIEQFSLPEDYDDQQSEPSDCINISLLCEEEVTDILFRDDNPSWGNC
ncbi:hypothetical protein [Haloterrigena salifodinae]|uniref:hypothetical protein n=1 Tax=Haloterrigena salifodinae TaxID=2675099 RepID=UPI000F887E35|nr:hypothetical protein [Haloterrigena salifodinae]